MDKAKLQIAKKWYEKFFPNKNADAFIEKASKYDNVDGDISVNELSEKKDAFLNLVVFMLKCEKAYNEYQKRGISDEIFYDTLKDIAVWEENYEGAFNKEGLAEIFWLNNHVSLNLFKIGRLQYQFETVWVESPKHKLKKGDKVLNLHITQGESLDYEVCKKSYDEANKFFSEKYPEFDYDYFACHTWFFDPEIKNFVSEKSNILKFASDFEIISYEEKNSAVRYVFGEKAVELPVDEYPEETSIQKRMKAFLKNGGVLRVGYGFRKKYL